MRLSGTSMATAVATGAIAQLLEANRAANAYPTRPSLTPNAVKGTLQYTGFAMRDSAGAPYGPLRQGAGSLNPKGAIALGRTINTAAPAGSYWLTSSPTPWTRIGSDDLHWSQMITWDTHIIWGTTIESNEAAWGSHIIWGTDVDWGDHIIWGTTDVVWANSYEWADHIIWGTQTIGMSDGDHIIWGTTGGLTPDNVAWGNLADGGASATSVTAK
jgi:hypothetical protein